MIKVTTVKKVLKEIAKEQPDTRAACYYSVEEYEWHQRRAAWAETPGNSYADFDKIEPKPVPQAPMCIVGQVVARINGIEALAQIPFGVVVEDEWSDSEYDGRAVFSDLGYSPAAIKVLAAAQQEQDGGLTWKEAVEKAL